MRKPPDPTKGNAPLVVQPARRWCIKPPIPKEFDMNDSQNRAAALTKNAPRSPIGAPVVALLKAEQQPFALIEDDQHRIHAMAGAASAFLAADEETQALVEAVLLPKGSMPPPWFDDTGMEVIGMFKGYADRWIKAQRKARKDKARMRLNLRLVAGGAE